MEIAREDETVALVWFNRVTDDVIECHACARPEWHGRWLTREVLRQLEYIVDHTNCRAVIGQIPSPEVARIWRRLGFKLYDTIAVLEIPEKSDG